MPAPAAGIQAEVVMLYKELVGAVEPDVSDATQGGFNAWMAGTGPALTRGGLYPQRRLFLTSAAR